MSSSLHPVRWALKPVHVEGLPPWIDIHPESGLSLGRADDNDLCLAAEAHASVSAHHVRFSFTEADPVLQDLGSTNGTYVNGIRVEQKTLKSGDVITLGQAGPKFVLQRRDDMAGTRLIHAPKVEPKFGESTIQLVREAVGLDEDHDVSAAVQRGTQFNRRVFVGVVALVAIVGGAIAWFLHDNSRREIDRLESLNAALRQQIEDTSVSLRKQQEEFVDQRTSLENEKKLLTERLQRLAADDKASSALIAELRNRLEATSKSLALYDPVNLERRRLDGVRSVREAVVFIETQVRLKDRDGDEFVRLTRTEDGEVEFELGGDGEFVSKEKTGSGFVVSAEGHVLTNAHVVESTGAFSGPIEMASGSVVEPFTTVEIVFNNDKRRFPAKVLAEVHDDDNDFALLKIDPFDAMPFIADFKIDRPSPSEGSEVFLFGFPLGRNIVQGSDDTVVASTFKGILSRKVKPYLQVDAAVHPGNSGGPVTDSTGNVIGIVTAVARMPEGAITPSIGYVMPIDAVSAVWPPKD